MKTKIALLIFVVMCLINNANSQPGTTPTCIEVAFLKTVHISFPAKIKYVDLGSEYILANKADEVDNVLRVKAAYKGFLEQTNFSVICEDGSFWLFQVIYNENLQQEYYQVRTIGGTLAVTSMPGLQEANLTDISGESPYLLDLITKSLYRKDSRYIKSVGQRKQQIEATIKGIYVHNDILYFHLSMRNKSNISYDINYINFNLCDQKKLRKQASQELPLTPVRVYSGNNSIQVQPNKEYNSIMAFNKFTIAPDKKITVYISEKNGGRHLFFDIFPEEILNARSIKSIEL